MKPPKQMWWIGAAYVHRVVEPGKDSTLQELWCENREQQSSTRGCKAKAGIKGEQVNNASSIMCAEETESSPAAYPRKSSHCLEMSELDLSSSDTNKSKPERTSCSDEEEQRSLQHELWKKIHLKPFDWRRISVLCVIYQNHHFYNGRDLKCLIKTRKCEISERLYPRRRVETARQVGDKQSKMSCTSLPCLHGFPPHSTNTLWVWKADLLYCLLLVEVLWTVTH